MFEIPSNPLIEKCIVTKETVVNKEAPKIIIDANRKKEQNQVKKERRTTNNKNNIETA